jgi:hypothetical protein
MVHPVDDSPANSTEVKAVSYKNFSDEWRLDVDSLHLLLSMRAEIKEIQIEMQSKLAHETTAMLEPTEDRIKHFQKLQKRLTVMQLCNVVLDLIAGLKQWDALITEMDETVSIAKKMNIDELTV